MSTRAERAEALRSTLPDDEVVDRVRAGEIGLFEILMRRYNERLYRVARSILRDEREAEDVMQDAYVRAYTYLDQYRGQARFSTWLTKIGVYEAMARARRRGRFVGLDDAAAARRSEAVTRSAASPAATPEDEASNAELGAVLHEAIEALPESHRTVFVLRQIEGLDTAETAECLDISPESVRVRLHRARAMLRQDVDRRIGPQTRSLYAFHLRRCDRVVAGVFERLASSSAGSSPVRGFE